MERFQPLQPLILDFAVDVASVMPDGIDNNHHRDLEGNMGYYLLTVSQKLIAAGLPQSEALQSTFPVRE